MPNLAPNKKLAQERIGFLGGSLAAYSEDETLR